MADAKISQLPSADTITGAEIVPLVQGVNTKSVTVDTLLTNKDVVLVHKTAGTPDYFMNVAGDNLSVVNAAPKTPVFAIYGGANAALPNARNIASSPSIIVDASVAGELSFDRAAITGPVMISEGSNVSSLGNAIISAQHIVDDQVTNDKLTPQDANTLKGNATASSANPTDIAVSANSLVGRGSGNIQSIGLDSSLAITAGVLGVVAGAGEANTASNVNVDGVGIFKQKSTLDLQFNGINTASDKVTVTLDSTNNTIDIDVVENNFLIGGRNTPLIGKFALTFSTGTADNDPTTGRFKFNSATIGSITTLWVDNLDANSRNIVNDLNTWVSGDKLFIYDSTGNTLHTICTLSSVATDKTGYRQFSGACAGGAGTLPANLATCIVVYVSKQLLGAILQVDNFARFQSNGAGGYNLITNTGVILESTVNVYALPGKTISGVPTLPAASSLPLGTSVLLHPDNFVGTGAPTKGVRVITDTVNWRADGPQTLFNDWSGTVASATWNRTTTGKFALAVDPKIPAGLLYAGASLRLRYSVINTMSASTTGATTRAMLGTDLVTHSNNQNLITLVGNTANNSTTNVDIIFHMTSTTSLKTPRGIVNNNSGSTSGWLDGSTNINTAADMMFSLEVTSMGTTATNVALQGFALEWLI